MPVARSLWSYRRFQFQTSFIVWKSGWITLSYLEKQMLEIISDGIRQRILGSAKYDERCYEKFVL
jgi:hypothetical protein